MFDEKHYVPILTGKAGEYRALQQLDPVVRANLTPLIEVPPIPWDHENDAASCTIDQHLAKTPDNMRKHWSGPERIFLDMWTVAEAGPMTNGDHPLTSVLDRARSVDLNVVPVTGLERDAGYQAAVTGAVATDERGVCIRILGDELSAAANIKDDLDSLLANLAVTPKEVDLLIDFGAMHSAYEPTYRLAIRSSLPALPHLQDWRTLTVAGSAFPDNMGGFPRDATSSTPRTEWRVWASLLSMKDAIGRMPTFGDYAIDSPAYPDLDFRVIKMTASIRYTHENDWILVKGHVNTKGGASQFPHLASILVGLPQYCGAEFSSSDAYINACATGSDGPGSATTWRQVGTDHHMTFVVKQIANYPGL